MELSGKTHCLHISIKYRAQEEIVKIKIRWFSIS